MPATFSVAQFVEGVAEWKDAEGNPAKVESVEWQSSNPAVATVTPGTDDFNKVRVDGAGPGESTITGIADARFGEEVKEILITDTVTITAAEAVSGGITWGTPQDAEGSSSPASRR